MSTPFFIRSLGSFFILFCLAALHVSAQGDLVGLWEVQLVTAAGETQTPEAKWFDLQADHYFAGGNGYLQNLAGSWQYDADRNELLFTDQDSVPDPDGPFTVEWVDGQLTLLRTEGETEISVSFQRVEHRPMAIWDKLVGSWLLQTDEADGEQSIFMRWDRLYFAHELEVGGGSGVWYFHPHRPELRLLSNRGDDFDSRWEVAFPEANIMTWTGTLDGEEQVWTFSRQY